MMTHTLPLHIKNMSKKCKDENGTWQGLNNVTLTVKRGESVAIIGPSRSGKSTLLSIAGLLQQADEGHVFINGENSAQYSEHEQSYTRLHTIGYMFKNVNLIPFLSVMNQLKVIVELDHEWNDNTKKRAESVLKMVGLSGKESTKIQYLSNNEKQRIAIARAFINMPDLILADEPTASLDHIQSNEIISLLVREVRDKKKAALVVTQDESILHLFNKVYEIHDGSLRLHSAHHQSDAM